MVEVVVAAGNDDEAAPVGVRETAPDTESRSPEWLAETVGLEELLERDQDLMVAAHTRFPFDSLTTFGGSG